MEWAASAMEMSVLSASNVANLVREGEGVQVVKEENLEKVEL